MNQTYFIERFVELPNLEQVGAVMVDQQCQSSDETSQDDIPQSS